MHFYYYHSHISSVSSIPGKRNRSRWKLRSHRVLMTFRKSEPGMHSRSFWMYMVILAHELLPLHPMADRFHWPIRSYHRPLPLPHPHDHHEAIYIRCLSRITTFVSCFYSQHYGQAEHIADLPCPEDGWLFLNDGARVLVFPSDISIP